MITSQPSTPDEWTIYTKMFSLMTHIRSEMKHNIKLDMVRYLASAYHSMVYRVNESTVHSMALFNSYRCMTFVRTNMTTFIWMDTRLSSFSTQHSHSSFFLSLLHFVFNLPRLPNTILSDLLFAIHLLGK